MSLKTLAAHPPSGKTVLLRVDYNVPLKERSGKLVVSDNSRIEASLETIKLLTKKDNKVVIISHLGRPKPGGDNVDLSLEPTARELQKLLPETKIQFIGKTLGAEVEAAIAHLKAGEVLVLENLRFHEAEKKGEAAFAKRLAGLGEVFVNDAFSVCHRAHASVVGLTKHLPSLAGLALEIEFNTWTELLTKPERPFVMIIGGAKISDKVGAVQHLAEMADIVLLGGGTANNFLKAEGIEIYHSYLEESQVMKKAGKNGGRKVNYVKIAEHLLATTRADKHLVDGFIPLPKLTLPLDVVAASSPESRSTKVVELTKQEIDAGSDDVMYLDIGPKTVQLFAEVIEEAGTIFWNGPLGVFEQAAFAAGTRGVAEAIVKSKAKKIVGGGDTIAALEKFGLKDKFDYVSTAGGAALDFLSGETLPGLSPLLK